MSLFPAAARMSSRRGGGPTGTMAVTRPARHPGRTQPHNGILALDARSAPRLALLFLGAILARGRPTATPGFGPPSNGEGARRELNPAPRDPQSRVLPLHHGHHRSRHNHRKTCSLKNQRKGRESNPQGYALARLPSGSRRPSGGPSSIVQYPDQDSNPGLLVRSEV